MLENKSKIFSLVPQKFNLTFGGFLWKFF